MCALEVVLYLYIICALVATFGHYKRQRMEARASTLLQDQEVEENGKTHYFEGTGNFFLVEH